MRQYNLHISITSDLFSLGPDSDRLRHRFDGELEPCGVLRMSEVLPLRMESEDSPDKLKALRKYESQIKRISRGLINPQITLYVKEVLENSREEDTEESRRILQELREMESNRLEYQI